MNNLVLILFAGDYREARERRAKGLADRYRHHSYALDSLAGLRAAGHGVTVIQMRSPELYDETVEDGTRFVGLGHGPGALKTQRIADVVEEVHGSHVMVRFPSVPVLEKLVQTDVQVSVVLADSFPSRMRNRKRYAVLGALLRHQRVDFVSNHQVNSSRHLRRVFRLDPSKVVPWDWPLDLAVMAASSTRAHPSGEVVTLCYVGSIERTKGVWDLLKAMEILRRRGLHVELEIAGSGKVDEMWVVVDRLGLRDQVRFVGRVGGDDVLAMMRRASLVCVPSRRSYPEGLPLTLYEAMASGTPLVASSHPMFRGLVRDGETAFVFSAGRPRSLAAAVERAWNGPGTYERVSAQAAAAYTGQGLESLWGELMLRWLRGEPADLAWLSRQSLAARHGLASGGTVGHAFLERAQRLGSSWRRRIRRRGLP